MILRLCILVYLLDLLIDETHSHDDDDDDDAEELTRMTVLFHRYKTSIATCSGAKF